MAQSLELHSFLPPDSQWAFVNTAVNSFSPLYHIVILHTVSLTTASHSLCNLLLRTSELSFLKFCSWTLAQFICVAHLFLWQTFSFCWQFHLWPSMHFLSQLITLIYLNTWFLHFIVQNQSWSKWFWRESIFDCFYLIFFHASEHRAQIYILVLRAMFNS